MGLIFFEQARGEKKSAEWVARQYRKVDGVIKVADEMVKKAGKGSSWSIISIPALILLLMLC
jgi:hypothetical protein